MGKLIKLGDMGVGEAVEDIVSDAKNLKGKTCFIAVWLEADDPSNLSFVAGGKNSDILWCVEALRDKIHNDFFDIG